MEDLDWVTGFVYPYINFTIFAFVLIKYGKKPLKEALIKRRRDYEALYTQVKEEKEAAEKKLKSLSSKLDGLVGELETLKRESEESAKRNASKVESEAKGIAENLVNDAKLVAKAEFEAAHSKLVEQVFFEVRGKVEQQLRSNAAQEHQKKALAGQLVELSHAANRLKGASL